MHNVTFIFKGLAVVDPNFDGLSLTFLNDYSEILPHDLYLEEIKYKKKGRKEGQEKNTCPGRQVLECSTIKIETYEKVNFDNPHGNEPLAASIIDLDKIHSMKLNRFDCPKIPTTRLEFEGCIPFSHSEARYPYTMLVYLDGRESRNIAGRCYTKEIGVYAQLTGKDIIRITGQYSDGEKIDIQLYDGCDIDEVIFNNMCKCEDQSAADAYDDFHLYYSVLEKPMINDKEEEVRLVVLPAKKSAKKEDKVEKMSLEISCVPVSGGGGS